MSDASVSPGNDPVPGNASAPAAATEVRQPEFGEVVDSSTPPDVKSINRFLDVQVTLSAELGRITIPIGELAELGEGSVIELNRSVNSPVDLFAQGVRVASGEVVVVDDCFAVRIKNIYSVESGE